MMTLNEFAELIRVETARRLGMEWHIEVIPCVKNNGQQMTQLLVQKQEDSIGTRIPLDEVFQAYQANGGKEFSKIVEEVFWIYSETKKEQEEIRTRFPDLREYRNVKDWVIFKLINAEMNSELLQSVPHMQYMDLAIVFYVYMKIDAESSASALIHNEHMSMWNITLDDLYEDAKKNTPEKLPYQFNNLWEVLNEMSVGEKGIPLEILGETEQPVGIEPLYVLSNKTRLDGAAVILYPGILKQCAEEIGGNLLVFPSSTHEVLLLHEYDGMDFQGLSSMVRDINETAVLETEILSNHVYYYHCEEDRIEIAA